jgi:hypothetical protein
MKLSSFISLICQMRYYFQQNAGSTLKARSESALLDELNQFVGVGGGVHAILQPWQRVTPQGNTVSGPTLLLGRCQISPLWSSGQGSWLHNGDVLCFL